MNKWRRLINELSAPRGVVSVDRKRVSEVRLFCSLSRFHVTIQTPLWGKQMQNNESNSGNQGHQPAPPPTPQTIQPQPDRQRVRVIQVNRNRKARSLRRQSGDNTVKQ